MNTIGQIEDLVAQRDHDAPFPAGAEGPRGRQGSSAKVVLPDGWLDDPEDRAVPHGAGPTMHFGG